MLKIKLLSDTAKAPTIAHPGEDIAYDVYSDEAVLIPPDSVRPVKTGFAMQFSPPAGAILKCRSGYARKLNMSVEGGVIDAGYRGEVMVLVRNHHKFASMSIVKGEKLAQMVRHEIPQDKVVVVDDLDEAARGEAGFGSTGRT